LLEKVAEANSMKHSAQTLQADSTSGTEQSENTGGREPAPEYRLDGRRPRHVGIIMDGNGRWASARGLHRIEGHRRGVEALRKAIRTAGNFRIPYITIYAFSAENWRRPAEEVGFLMGLLRRFIRNDLAELHKSGVRVRIIGSRENLPADILDLLNEAEDLTRANRNMTLAVAFNYGGRQEIVEAARTLARKVASSELSVENIDATAISDHLTTNGMPDPDLIIRTSGEQRLSNFLLWQAAYAEFVFLPVNWPDFDDAAFRGALEEYARRDRRYGEVAPAKPLQASA
jgi:undecaprenyl diphosphate synthase